MDSTLDIIIAGCDKIDAVITANFSRLVEHPDVLEACRELSGKIRTERFFQREHELASISKETKKFEEKVKTLDPLNQLDCCKKIINIANQIHGQINDSVFVHRSSPRP